MKCQKTKTQPRLRHILYPIFDRRHKGCSFAPNQLVLGPKLLGMAISLPINLENHIYTCNNLHASINAIWCTQMHTDAYQCNVKATNSYCKEDARQRERFNKSIIRQFAIATHLIDHIHSRMVKVWPQMEYIPFNIMVITRKIPTIVVQEFLWKWYKQIYSTLSIELHNKNAIPYTIYDWCVIIDLNWIELLGNHTVSERVQG